MAEAAGRTNALFTVDEVEVRRVLVKPKRDQREGQRDDGHADAAKLHRAALEEQEQRHDEGRRR